jgi:hypothetical protein
LIPGSGNFESGRCSCVLGPFYFKDINKHELTSIQCKPKKIKGTTAIFLMSPVYTDAK